jgi:hypothetical protein
LPRDIGDDPPTLMVVSVPTVDQLCRCKWRTKDHHFAAIDSLSKQGRQHLFAIGVTAMCDYSLQLVASRPARVGEKLVSTRFSSSVTRGFASVEDPNVAVCLLPGTELAFEDDVQCESAHVFRSRRQLGHKVAQFRQVNLAQPNAHHDALEFPDGKIVLLTELCEGQRATVLQMPAAQRAAVSEAQRQEALAV